MSHAGRPKKGNEIQRADVLTMVITYCVEFGVPPSVREVASYFRLASTSGAFHHLRGLVRDGQMRQVRGMYLPVNVRSVYTDSTGSEPEPNRLRVAAAADRLTPGSGRRVASESETDAA